jgi:hypothetical protein
VNIQRGLAHCRAFPKTVYNLRKAQPKQFSPFICLTPPHLERKGLLLRELVTTNIHDLGALGPGGGAGVPEAPDLGEGRSRDHLSAVVDGHVLDKPGIRLGLVGVGRPPVAEARSSPAGVGSIAAPSSVEGATAKTTRAAKANRAAGLDRKASGVSNLERPEVTVLVDG